MENLTPKFLLARKIGMTQIFNDDKTLPVTVLEALPAEVIRIKDKDKDGYNAVVLKVYIQTSADYMKMKNNTDSTQTKADDNIGTTQNNAENLKKQKGKKIKYKLKEFRFEGELPFKIGDKIDVSIFNVGELVNVRSQRKAKGFAGVVKRHGFAGGPRTHGQKNKERAPGSIGQRWPQRVRKGLKMAGRIAPIYVTVKNLEIVDIVPEKNLILVNGSIPGPGKRLVELRSAFITNKGKIYLTKDLSKNLKRFEVSNLSQQ